MWAFCFETTISITFRSKICYEVWVLNFIQDSYITTSSLCVGFIRSRKFLFFLLKIKFKIYYYFYTYIFIDNYFLVVVVKILLNVVLLIFDKNFNLQSVKVFFFLIKQKVFVNLTNLKSYYRGLKYLKIFFGLCKMILCRSNEQKLGLIINKDKKLSIRK